MDRAGRRQQMREDVALMRDLGVLRWGSVWLGPATSNAKAAPDLTPEQAKLRAAEAAERRHTTLFAASSVKPRLRPAIDQKTDEDHARLARVTAAHHAPPGVTGQERGDGLPE